jgi:3-hydroxyisobutyrate dehydrogenase-like beta-hydroxyacid dehydrogenase
MSQLGFIGLGKMGGRVAKRLLDAGHMLCWLRHLPLSWAESTGFMLVRQA